MNELPAQTMTGRSARDRRCSLRPCDEEATLARRPPPGYWTGGRCAGRPGWRREAPSDGVVWPCPVAGRAWEGGLTAEHDSCSMDSLWTNPPRDVFYDQGEVLLPALPASSAMADLKGFPRTPLALVVDDQEWTARSLESILSPSGYAVLKAYTGRQAVELARKVQPEIMVIDMHLPDMRGVDVCREARKLPTIRPSTPIVMLTTSPLGRAERIEALRAGAWDVVRPPFDPEELILKIGAFVAAKQEADTAREESLLDPITGFYNVKGLLKRVGEITAEATRSRRPLACVVLGMHRVDEAVPAGEADESVPDRITAALASTARVSDIMGRLGEGSFVVVAPGTDPSGALELARRLLEAADQGLGPAPEALPLSLRAGYYAVHDTEQAPVTPVDLLTRATLALRSAQADESGERIHAYQPTRAAS